MRKTIIFSSFAITICGIIYSCQNATEREFEQYKNGGKDLYTTYCLNCHGAKGEGFSDLYPPLTDTVFLKGYRSKLACLIKNGSNQPVLIHGKKYEGKMPAFKTLATIDVAKIIVYVTNNFGNHQGMYDYRKVELDLEKYK